MEKGQSLGEIPPGQHTLANIADRLKFWSQKTATVIVARNQDIPLEMTCPAVMTSEFLEVDITLSLTVQIDDVALFFTNLMGARSTMSVSDLKQIISPLLQQALSEAVGRLSIKDLVADQKRADIESLVAQALRTSLNRYGLRFGAVQTLAIAHPEYDAQQRRIGELWLQRQELSFDQEAAKLAADKLFTQIEQQEKTNDLQILKAQTDADHMEAELVVRRRRIGLRKQLREAALAGEFDRITNEEELQQFLQQRDQARLIRDDELASLQSALRDKATDRTAAREHLLRKLDLEQQADLESVRIDLDHQARVKRLQHELQLADLNQSEESKAWKRRIEKEIQESAHRRTEGLKTLQHDVTVARESASSRRFEELEDVMHRQRAARIEAELEYETASSRQRIALLEHETRITQENALLELEQRKTQRTAEIDRKAGVDQIERLRLLNEVNLVSQRAQHDMQLEAERQRTQLEVMKLETEGKIAVAKSGAIRGASEFEIMAAAPDVAAHVADVLKAKAIADASIATSNAQVAGNQAATARERELQNQLTASEKASADKAIAAFREAMQAQQNAFQQFGSTLGDVTKNLGSAAPQMATPAASAAPTDGTPSNHSHNPRRVILCADCRSENDETDRHCRRCGKTL